jgi:hypothetical protein
MTPSQIITQEAQKYGGNADIMLRKINKLVQGKAGMLIQKNDSVLLLIAISKTASEVHLFTMDTPAKLKGALKYFIQKTKESDIQTLYGPDGGSQSEELKKTLHILDSLGLNVQKSNIPGYYWMAELR